MNILFWILQVLLALHTAMGGVWKFSHSPQQTMPSLSAIPNTVWIVMAVLELLCSVGLVLPAVNQKTLGILVPIALAYIAAEMLVFCAMHLVTGDTNYGPMIYWVVVAAFCALIAYGRLVLRPL